MLPVTSWKGEHCILFLYSVSIHGKVLGGFLIKENSKQWTGENGSRILLTAKSFNYFYLNKSLKLFMFEQLIIFSLNNSEFRVVSANILLNKCKERLSFNYILKERLIIELRDIEKQHGTHLTTLPSPFFGPLLTLLSFCPNIRGKHCQKIGQISLLPLLQSLLQFS